MPLSLSLSLFLSQVTSWAYRSCRSLRPEARALEASCTQRGPTQHAYKKGALDTNSEPFVCVCSCAARLRSPCGLVVLLCAAIPIASPVVSGAREHPIATRGWTSVVSPADLCPVGHSPINRTACWPGARGRATFAANALSELNEGRLAVLFLLLSYSVARPRIHISCERPQEPDRSAWHKDNHFTVQLSPHRQCIKRLRARKRRILPDHDPYYYFYTDTTFGGSFERHGELLHTGALQIIELHLAYYYATLTQPAEAPREAG